MWGDDGFRFGDLIDIVNPLQHVPIVSWAYRALTGDTIAPAAKVLGGRTVRSGSGPRVRRRRCRAGARHRPPDAATRDDATRDAAGDTRRREAELLQARIAGEEIRAKFAQP